MRIYNEPPKGVIFEHSDFKHFFDTSKELYDNLAGVLTESGSPTRITGVEFVKDGQNYSCSEGWLLWNKTFYKVEAFEGTALGSQIPVFSIAKIAMPNEPHDLYEGINPNGHFTMTENETFKISFAASGTGLFDYNNIIDNPVKRNSDAVAKHQGFLPYMVVEYCGPLSYFDATGLGLGPYIGFAFCNGQNGTPDKRGKTSIGLADGAAPNGNEDANNTEYFVIGNTGGSSEITLEVGQLPSHDHPVNDPGHDHDVSSDGDRGPGGSGRENIPYDANARENNNTSTSTTGITVGNTGDNNPIDIRQSYIVMGYIMKLP